MIALVKSSGVMQLMTNYRKGRFLFSSELPVSISDSWQTHLHLGHVCY